MCFAPLDLESSSARSSQLAGRLLDVVFPHMGRSILDYVSGNQTHVRQVDVRLEKDQDGFSVGPFNTERDPREF